MASTASELLRDACLTHVACASKRDLLVMIAQSTSFVLDQTAEQLLVSACTSGVACLSDRDLWVVIAQSVVSLLPT